MNFYGNLTAPISLCISVFDIEAFRRDLKTAEANATAFLPRYAAIFQTEHDQIESAARSLHVPKEIAGPFARTRSVTPIAVSTRSTTPPTHAADQ